MDNVFGGVLVFYLVATAWITARREEGKTGIVDVIGLLIALAIAALAAIYGIEAAQSPTGTKGRSQASDFVVPVVVATLAAIGDARILLHGGLRGAQRIARHLWRMCFALFIASAAIFVARPQLFPAFLSKTHILFVILFVIGILPLILMVFWLPRVLLTKAFKRIAPPYWVAPPAEYFKPLDIVERHDIEFFIVQNCNGTQILQAKLNPENATEYDDLVNDENRRI
jgi:hypothetical protein